MKSYSDFAGQTKIHGKDRDFALDLIEREAKEVLRSSDDNLEDRDYMLIVLTEGCLALSRRLNELEAQVELLQREPSKAAV